ncbi:MAG: hypothetical protein V7L26_09275 [Nostoc sp.]
MTEQGKRKKKDLLKSEQRLVELYRARITAQIQPPKPTTGAAVSA